MSLFQYFPKNPTRLVLSGGGSKGIAILGALHYLYEQQGLTDIKEYWGTSVGSVIGLLLLIGYSPFEIFYQFFHSEQFSNLQSFNFQNILQEAAFCHISNLGNKVRSFMEKKLGENTDLTFADLYKQFGKKIHIIGANTDTMRGECFDVDQSPTMKIIDAIEISCDLPFIFSKKVYNGQVYVDGGIVNNYPVNLADNGIDYCIGICVFGGNFGVSKMNDILGWTYRLLHMPIMELHRERISRLSDKFVNLELTVDNLSMIEFHPSQQKKNEIFSTGYQQAKTKLTRWEEDFVQTKALFEYVEEDGVDGWEW